MFETFEWTRHLWLLSKAQFLFMAAAAWLCTSNDVALAGHAEPYPIECRITTDIEAHVYLDKEGDYILRKGTSVYAQTQFGSASMIKLNGNYVGFSLREGIDKYIDCFSERSAGDYPIIIYRDESGSERLEKLIAELFGRTASSGEIYECPSFGDGSPLTSIPTEWVEWYGTLGFDANTLCMVLQSGQIRYDPESGERLPTYQYDNSKCVTSDYFPACLSMELLLFPPFCMARGQTRLYSERLYVETKPLGCEINYHPWSGRRLSKQEREFFNAEAALTAYGDAGPSVGDSESLAQERGSRATEAKIRAIREVLKAKADQQE